MESGSPTKSHTPQRRVIGFASEMKSLEQWLADPGAETQLFSISGIGGIGKTTLLIEMADKSRHSSALTLWLDGQGELSTSGAFLSSIEEALINEYGRVRSPEVPLLSYILSELSRQRTVLVIDNCENIERIEGWLLSSFLSKLKSASVLLIVASRSGLPVKWFTNPFWGTRIQSFPLKLFTRDEVLEYLRGSGLEAEVQLDIAQRTEGHPLLLALTVDLLRSQEGQTRSRLNEIPSILSTEMLREVASPTLYQALSVLSLLPAANQQLLNDLLEVPIDASNYLALHNLSFVRVTQQGLSLHHVVSRLLRDDFVQRNPEQFQILRQQVFKLLAEQFHAADKRRQIHIAAYVLELYREYLPTAHAYVDFSSILKPGEPKPFQPEDLPDLHRFLAASLAQSDWQSELTQADDYHDLLEDIAKHCPEGICVVRNENGIPLAFCAGFRLHALTLPILKRYAPQFIPILGDEAELLRQLPPEAADSICVLLAAVDVRQSLYRPEELGALLMQQWLIDLTSGWRGIMVTADPQLNTLLPILGFQESERIHSLDSSEMEMIKWVLDFRHTTFDVWVQNVIRQTEPAANERMTPQVNRTTVAIDGNAIKPILQHLFHPDKLEQMPTVKQLNMTGAALQKRVEEILAADHPPYPLTLLEQRILIESFLQKNRNKNQLAEAFHMSRTTFYRHSKLAMNNLAYVLTHS